MCLHSLSTAFFNHKKRLHELQIAILKKNVTNLTFIHSLLGIANFSTKYFIMIKVYTDTAPGFFSFYRWTNRGITIIFGPGRVAQSVGHLTRKSGVLGSIPGLATYFRFSFRFFKKGSCQLLAKVCARSTG